MLTIVNNRDAITFGVGGGVAGPDRGLRAVQIDEILLDESREFGP
jgi:hypothetical protein